MNAHRIAFRPPTVGPCNASPVHRRFARRPRTGRTPPVAARSPGPQLEPSEVALQGALIGGPAGMARRVAATWAAVRPAPPVSAPPRGRAPRPGFAARPAVDWAPGRRSRHGANRGSSGRSWPAMVGPAARTDQHARPVPGRGPAGPAAWWSGPGRPPRGLTHTKQPDRPGPLRPDLLLIRAGHVLVSSSRNEHTRGEASRPAGRRQGSGRVGHRHRPTWGQQPPVSDGGGQLPRRHRAHHPEPATRCGGDRADHLDRIGEQRPSRSGSGHAAGRTGPASR